MSKRIKISASLLDDFLVVKAGKYGADADRLRNKILRREPPNVAMLRGSAYHEIVEKGTAAFLQPDPLFSENLMEAPEDQTVTVRVFDDRLEGEKKYVDVNFTVGAVIPAMQEHERYQDGVHEVWNTQDRMVKGWTVITNQRYDQLVGATHIEYKTTGSAPSWLRYFESIQWRVYQQGLPEVSETVYRVFHLGKNNDWCRFSEYRYGREAHEPIIRQAMEELISWLENEPECLEKLILQ